MSFQLKTWAPGSSSENSDLQKTHQGHWDGSAFLSQSRADLTAGSIEPSHFQPYQQSLFQETDYMVWQNQCHFVVTCCEESMRGVCNPDI